MQPTPPPSEANFDEKGTSASEKKAEKARRKAHPPPPQNFRSPPFPILAELLENLANDRRQENRRRRLSTWFNGWRRDVGKDLYPVLRLLLPQKDRERSVYGLKEKNLAKTYIKLIPLGMRDPDAIRLLNWKRPTDRDKSSGDFPTVLFEVVSKRSSVTQGSLTVDQINDILDQLSQNIGKSDIQSKLLQRIYNSCTPEEQRWIARIILKDMQINVKESTVLAVFHPDALDLFNACSDLKKVAHELWDPDRRLNEADKQVHLSRPFAPMLCKRPAARLDDTIKDMHGQPFIIEEKLDGERIQLHKRGKEFLYYSRKGKDYTYLYGANQESGSLTPYIHNAFDERVDEIILDGEMLVWDPVSERNLPFGTLKTAALGDETLTECSKDKAKSMANPRPCFKVFDLLYLNGICLSRRSLKFRKRNLKSCMKEVRGRVEFVTEYEGRNATDVRKRLEEVMASRGEGLILKHPASEYVLNGRNKDWVKVKPEYMDNLGETVDLLVVGGNYGSGYRSGGVSTLICAVRDDRRVGGSETKYSTFVRIGTGLSFADYVWIRQKNWKHFDRNNIPSWYQSSKKGTDDKGDIYLEPEDSFILKVKAAEITPSEQYHLGFTMRFPRAVSIRDDLGTEDCMSATAVLESLKTERKRKMEETDSQIKKKRKAPKKPISVMPEYQGEKLKDVDVQSDIFEGIKFMVASDPRNRNGDKEKKELQKLIRTNGGKYVQIAKGIEPILVVYGGTTIPYDIKLIMDKDIHDVIRPSWIYDCVERGQRLTLHRKYFFHATSDRKLSKDYNAVDGESEEPKPEGGAAGDAKDARPPPSEPGTETQDDEDAEMPSQRASEIDPSMADWFKVDKPAERPPSSREAPEDSETDPDSDYDELRFDEEAEEWVLPDKSHPVGENGTPSTLRDTQETPAQPEVKMGEDDNAIELDPEKIFRHFRFYLDTPANVERYGMEFKSKYKDQIASSFAEIEELIVSNGGRVTADLDDPKLTHVILDKRDTSRRKELIARTSKPKRRYLVLGDFIHACVEEHSLLDEDGFVP